jgi:hypothetical protein
MNDNTSRQFDEAVASCRRIFMAKMKDYGTSWRILRTPSLTDQVYIKANRIRSIDQKGMQKINEGIVPEFIGIINYSVMALIQLEIGNAEETIMEEKDAMSLFEKYIDTAKRLMMDKNHDYGEAWRSMRVSSFTDIIMMKLLRIKQIEDHQGQTFISEGIDANYFDIINYAVFALIRLQEAAAGDRQAT